MARHDAKDRSQGTPAWRSGRRLELPDTPLSTRFGRRAEMEQPQREAPDAAGEQSPPLRQQPRSAPERTEPAPQSRQRGFSRKEQPQSKRTLIGKETWPRRTKLAPFPPFDDDLAATPLPDPGPAQPDPPSESTQTGAEADRPVAAEAESARRGRLAERDAAVDDEPEKLPSDGGAARGKPRRVRVEPQPPETFGKKVARALLGLFILAGAVGVYLIWARQARREALPPMFMPQPYYYEEEQPVHAVILWREQIVQAPAAGTVQLAFGQKPATVAAGDVVATVLSRGRGTPVRVSGRGYFLPALDGAADDWEYAKLWIGSGLLPAAPPLRWVQDLAQLDTSRAVGRLITLPQAPRAIFYLDLTDTLRNALKRGVITIRRESRGPKWASRVRVYTKYSEQRAKVCIEMPYFPMDMVLSRTADFLVCSAEDSGLLVPDSAVTIRNGTYGVFELVGDQLVFRSVTGRPARDGMFFVASGLSPGNPVIVNAANAEEKRVRLW